MFIVYPTNNYITRKYIGTKSTRLGNVFQEKKQRNGSIYV